LERLCFFGFSIESHTMNVRLPLVLSGTLVLCIILYMTLEARGNWGFVLPFRGAKLGALLLISVAISSSTVLFQTITQNRILTPSIMGFDALYILLLTGAVYFLGGQEFIRLPEFAVYVVNVVLVIGASLLLFGTLLAAGRQDMMRMILTGIVFGTLFRSLTVFLQRMIDPNEYAVIQISSYARFNQINTDLLAISAVLALPTLAIAWRSRFKLDVLALGYDAAVNLGVEPRRAQFQVLALIAILVSVSTALVGPVAFLGLLVVSVARRIAPSANHAVLLPTAALISAIVLVGGQMMVERVFAMATPLTVVIDFAGGLIFLFLLLKGSRK
jgi:iron complex transport system permease protein